MLSSDIACTTCAYPSTDMDCAISRWAKYSWVRSRSRNGTPRRPDSGKKIQSRRFSSSIGTTTRCRFSPSRWSKSAIAAKVTAVAVKSPATGRWAGWWCSSSSSTSGFISGLTQTISLRFAYSTRGPDDQHAHRQVGAVRDRSNRSGGEVDRFVGPNVASMHSLSNTNSPASTP